jgi:GT2 family glycosyltransferase
VIIPTYNRIHSLKRCLVSVLTQSRIPNEILIIDGSDSDSIYSLYECFGDFIKIIKSDVGLTRQRNIGLKSLSNQAEIVLFLDDDLELELDYIEKIINCYEGDVKQKIGGVEGYPLIDGPHRRKIKSYPVYEQRLSLYGCNMSYRVSKIQGELFDENLKSYAWLEDLDFSLRIGRNSKLVRVNNAHCYHYTSPKARIGNRKYGYMQIANWYYLNKKNSLPGLITANVFLYPFKNLIRLYDSRYRERFIGNMKAIYRILKYRHNPIEIISK